MFKIKGLQTILSALTISAMMIAASSCIGDQSVAKKRGIVKDFSVDKGNENGCGTEFLKYESPYDTCTNVCTAGTATTPGFHLASLEELSEIKQELVANGNSSLLTVVNGSANLCVPDVTAELRPTNAIDIKSDFCSCVNGKSDIINNCDSFCAAKAASDQPILYVNTIVGTDIALNTKLGNLHNWCTVQLADDETSPACSIVATDGTNNVILPVNTVAGSNSFNVNVKTLAENRTWILKLVETKTGTAAQSKEFQIRRKSQTTDSTDILGALKVTPINQYTCMSFGASKTDSLGNIIRANAARVFYYFAANETPAPVAPPGGTNQSPIVCHDEQLHPGNDNAEYDRLELIPGAITMWDKADTRFVAKTENAGKLTINKILQDRMLAEHNITVTIDLFRLLSYPNRPTSATITSTSIPLGYIMVPFTDPNTGKTYCPTETHFTGNQPIMNLMGEYMDSTEGIFVAEKEGETIPDGASYRTIYGTMFVRESTLKDYGFYIENGLKIRADSNSMNSKTIYYYWPLSTTADALTQGGRKLFTVRTPATLNGNVPTGQSTTEPTTDKRIGCIPKS